MLNTHFYDGKITNELPIQKLMKEKQEYGQDLLDSCKHIDKKAIKYLKTIVKDIGTPKNIDSTNKLNADDLLCLCWMHRNNKDFIDELEIQLLDMATGFCPQGRTHRLYQLLLAFDLH